MHLFDLEIIVDPLLQMDHPIRSGRPEHGFTVDAIDPEAALVGYRLLEFFQAVIRDMLIEIHGIHTPSLRASESRVFGIVPEYDDITGLGFQDGSGDFFT